MTRSDKQNFIKFLGGSYLQWLLKVLKYLNWNMIQSWLKKDINISFFHQENYHLRWLSHSNKHTKVTVKRTQTFFLCRTGLMLSFDDWRQGLEGGGGTRSRGTREEGGGREKDEGECSDFFENVDGIWEMRLFLIFFRSANENSEWSLLLIWSLLAMSIGECN